MATAPLTKPESVRRQSRGSVLQRYGTEVTLASILIVLCIFLSFTSPVFLTSGNLSNLVKQSAINGIIALGMTVVIITGGIDLSVGSVVGLAGMIAGMLMTSGIAPWLAAIAAVISCVFVGIGDGGMVHACGIAAFV